MRRLLIHPRCPSSYKKQIQVNKPFRLTAEILLTAVLWRFRLVQIPLYIQDIFFVFFPYFQHHPFLPVTVTEICVAFIKRKRHTDLSMALFPEIVNGRIDNFSIINDNCRHGFRKNR